MRIPVRILRATADNRHPPPPPTARTREREERILAVTQTIMAEHGPETFTFADLALTLRIDRATLRRHFPDLESLLGKILRRHLNRVTRAVAEIHPDDRTATKSAAAPTTTPRTRRSAASTRPTCC
ncbi:MAG: TetR/AcrR family transcriptional regulator [Rhodospirillales bacterium]